MDAPPETASIRQSGSAINHSNKKGRPSCRYEVKGIRIDYWDDTGFTADGTFVSEDEFRHGGPIAQVQGSSPWLCIVPPQWRGLRIVVIPARFIAMGMGAGRMSIPRSVNCAETQVLLLRQRAGVIRSTLLKARVNAG